MLPAVARLLAQTTPDQAVDLAPCIRAVEVNTRALAICRKRLAELLRQRGWRTSQSSALLNQWLVHGDFLTVPLKGSFTHVVGNPPYVRLENLPKELLKLYRSRWTSLYDRADL